MIVLAWELMGIYRLGLVFAKIRDKQKCCKDFQSVAKISMSLQGLQRVLETVKLRNIEPRINCLCDEIKEKYGTAKINCQKIWGLFWQSCTL